ncbi:hypothetical protein OIU79_009167 [Salix purpurea]|uniref:Uncharacterized protein n=1 Tax=Salix purpurea TaxID=77065 RepID=A0A9Q0TK57_SALPP|nr:hypothetical protein OIU79_009167 [Salix purpurea]
MPPSSVYWQRTATSQTISNSSKHSVLTMVWAY